MIAFLAKCDRQRRLALSVYTAMASIATRPSTPYGSPDELLERIQRSI